MDNPRKKIIMTIVIEIILLLTVITVIFILGSRNKQKEAAELLELGQKYLEEMDYEQAIVCFEKVLELEPKNVDAYLQLADVYTAMGNSEKAIEVLQQGLTQVDSKELERAVDKLEEKIEENVEGDSAEEVSVEEETDAKEDIELPEEDEISSEEDIQEIQIYDVNKYLSILSDNGIGYYSANKINEERLLWFVIYIFYTEKYDEIKVSGEQYVLEEEKVEEVLKYYFDIEAPKGNFGDVRYENGKYYFPAFDYGSLGMGVVITEKIEQLGSGNYKVLFNSYYVWPEDFETGESNPKDDWEEYYNYSIEQMESDPFCEKERIGEAKFHIQDGRIIVEELIMSSGVEEY